MISLVKLQAAALSLAVPIAVFGVRDEIRDSQWHLDFLDIGHAHEVSTGEGVVVAVVDTGVDGGHPDLARSLLPGMDFSVEHLSNALIDRDGHGTAMAGIIAANGRTLGIAPGATILPVRKSSFGITALGSSEAINWAVDQGADVLCLAFGQTEPDPKLQAAIERAIARDVVVVAAVGNVPEEPGFPASYPGVVGAAGVNRMGDHAEVSVVTSAAVLAAPAVDITSTAPRSVVPSGYGTGTGTSNATAIIAGVAALVRAAFPELSAEQVIHRMTTTAQDRGKPGRDDEYGYGVVDPVAALTAPVRPLGATATGPQGVDTQGFPTARLLMGAVAVVISALTLLAVGRLRRTR